MHKHTRTHTQTHIHTHPFTRTPVTHTNSHASTRSHAHTYAYTLTQTLRTVPLCQRTNSVTENLFRAIWMLFCAMWMSQGIHEWITAHVWRSHGTHMKESWYRAFVPAHKLLNGNAILRLLHHLQCLRMCVCERTFDFLDMIYVKMYCVCVRLYLRI